MRPKPCFTQDELTRFRKPAKVRTAVVIGRWGDDTALLRLEDGTTLEAPVPEQLRDAIDVGAKVDLKGDIVVAWHQLEERC
jgi:hypothetical protein